MRNSTLLFNSKVLKFKIFALLMLFFVASRACDCVPKGLADNQVSSLKYASHIFIGKVVYSNFKKNVFKIVVTEKFKGKFTADTIEGAYFDSCSRFPDKGKWLIYGQLHNGRINISSCGLSRSFQYPSRVNVREYNDIPLWMEDLQTLDPKTDSVRYHKAKMKQKEWNKKQYDMASKDLQKEVEKLRNMK